MYSFQSTVRYSEVDESGALSVPALLDYLQDSCLFQAESLGHGVAYTRECGLAWLLSAWRVEINRLPCFTERIEVSTWATAFNGLYAHRNFAVDVCDADGCPAERVARADSLWFMFDGGRGRPVRAPLEETGVYDDDLAHDAPLAMVPVRRRIPVEGDGEPAEPVVVVHAHIDTNHHVNNAQYVAMAHGVLPAGMPVRCLEVQYVNAARLGDTVHPRVHRPTDADPGWTVVLADDAGHPYAVVRVE